MADSPPPPNEKLAELVDVLGEADTRELAGIFLESFPGQMKDLASGDRPRSHRAAHSMKSSAQQMGLPELARRMADLETRLAKAGEAVTSADLEGAAADFARVEGPLRAFAGA